MTAFSKFLDRFPTLAKTMVRAHQNKRIAHSYLLHADDEDVRAFAPIAMAQLLACRSHTQEGYPCQKCPICLGLENGTYSAFFKLVPTSKSRMIKVGEDSDEAGSMRWFESQFYLASARDDAVKIGVIYEAECMNEQAQNAFLKTLEEPPPQTYFFLVTGQLAQLLTTIRSRCQKLTLLSNQCHYTQDFVSELSDILHALRFEADHNIVMAERQAQRLIDIAQGLMKIASDVQQEKWSAQLEKMKEDQWDRSEQKQIEDRMQAAVSADYLALREAFTQAIYDYFAISYQLALGIDQSLIHNTELRVRIADGGMKISEAKCKSQLDVAERFINNLRYNVNETLLIRTFALELAFAEEYRK